MKSVFVVALLTMAALIQGCAYRSAVMVDKDRVIVLRNGFFGAARTAYVCKVSDSGLTRCAESESP